MITVKEIAALAGVSAKTAERALSGVTKDIRRDARERAERVRRIAQEHGYRPSELALALRRGRVQSLGFMVDILTDPFLAAAAETAMDEAAKKDYKVALKVVRFDPVQTREALEQLLASGVDGIMTSCSSDQLPRELMRTLEKQNFPVFTLCARSAFGFSAAAPDYAQALPEAVRSLAERGHRRITLCLFAGKKVDNERNGKLFRECCRRCQVEADFRIHDDRYRAAELADQRLPAVILYGKYSMRIYQDRCAELKIRPDTVGIYNEWTLSAGQDFPLHGIILERAESTVRFGVRQLISQAEGGGRKSFFPLAEYVPKEKLRLLKVQNFANQMLLDQ